MEKKVILSMSLRDDVLKNDFSQMTEGTQREDIRGRLWHVAHDLYSSVDAMDMCVPYFKGFTKDEHEDFVMMYCHDDTSSLVLLRGYVLTSE